MPDVMPLAHLGVILSSGNRTVEAYFRAFAPKRLGIHVTRMRMGSGGVKTPEKIQADAIQCAELLADAKVDLIDLQATGIMMERGPDGEAEIVRTMSDATGIPVYTATQSVADALRALAVENIILINPYGDDALVRERTYLEAAGFTVTHAFGLGRGEESNKVTPGEWVTAACEHDRDEADGIFLSGSNTRMLEAIAEIERTLGKPAVTSIQAALWTGVRRLAPKLGDVTSPAVSADPGAAQILGRLFEDGL
jgi:maleate isomerase